MNISEVLKIKQLDDSTVYVQVIAEEFTLDRAQTLYDPPEYRSAIVESFVNISAIEDYVEYDVLTNDIVSQYLECIDYELDWKETDDY